MRNADEKEVNVNYLDYLYSQKQGQYPQLLCNYLVKRYNLKGFLLDIGCGTGQHCEGFWQCGITNLGIDKPDCDLETGELFWGKPEFNEKFDIVFSKSVIEHIHNTEHLLSEIYRVLKPGGLVICLTPDWHTDYRMFYDDCTHVRPFTKKGLAMAFTLAGFKDVQCEDFYQLPILWRHQWLKFIPIVMGMIPTSWKYNRKGEQRVWIRHSKERMLLLTGRRP